MRNILQRFFLNLNKADIINLKSDLWEKMLTQYSERNLYLFL